MSALRTIDPRTGAAGPVVAHTTAPGELDRICDAAAAADDDFAASTPARRAALLRSIAASVVASADEIIDVADRETALGMPRLQSELGRTAHQLEHFAQVLLDGAYLDATIDHTGIEPGPPTPDLRRVRVPVGPVAVFTAGNFPLAFGVIGTDSAAALAAGCPVIVKAHPSYPATAERMRDCVQQAFAEERVSRDAFALVHGFEAGAQLVQHDAIRAVAFTGSQRGGRALEDLIRARREPVPFYGEFGSLNPVFVTRRAALERGRQIAEGFVASFTQGVGQFCTKPGLLLLPDDASGAAITENIGSLVAQHPGGVLITDDAQSTFTRRANELAASSTLLASGSDVPSHGGFAVAPMVVRVAVDQLLEDRSAYLDECFGPFAVVVHYGSDHDLPALAARMPGTLAASVFSGSSDDVAPAVAAALGRRSGRIVWNEFPTGVVVGWATHHGGPHPATSNPLFTSVGGHALDRFLRPVAWQNAPTSALPEALRDDNPLGIPQRVNGELRMGRTPSNAPADPGRSA